MNGRTYYEGIVFKPNNTSEATFDVSNYSEIDFTLGHVDGTSLVNGKLTIYLDDKSYDEIALTPTMNLTDYTLDVQKAKTVRFDFVGDNYSGNTYGFGDISADDMQPAVKYTVPKYETAEDFINSGFDTEATEFYDATSRIETFNMNGRTYSQGVTFTLGNTSYAMYNVENADELSFTIGHVDDTSLVNGKLTIYLDDKSYDEIALTPTMNLTDYTLDVQKAKTVRFYFVGDNYSGNTYGLGDIKVGTQNTYLEPSKLCTVPNYGYDTAEFLKSMFNKSGATGYDGTERTKNFAVSENTYTEGMTLLGSRYGYATFNTECFKSMTFTIGHVDGTNDGDTVLTIYADDAEVDKINLSVNDTPKDYELDVDNVSTVRFELDGRNYDDRTWAFYNIKLSDKSIAVSTTTTSTTTTTTTTTEPEETTKKPMTTTTKKPTTKPETTATTKSTTKDLVIKNVEIDKPVEVKTGEKFTIEVNQPNVTYKSSDDSIATVSKTGVVTPKKPGTVYITVFNSYGDSVKFEIIIKFEQSTKPEEKIHLGDPTGDGKITAEDATFVLIVFANFNIDSNYKISKFKECDVNRDGKVTAEDATAILIYFATGLTDPNIPPIEDFKFN